MERIEIMHKYFENIRYVLNSIFLDFVELIMKGAQSDFFFFIFSNVLGNLVSQEGYIFLMTHAKFYS